MLLGITGVLLFCFFPGALISRRFLAEKKSLLEYGALSVLISVSFNYSMIFVLGLFKTVNLFSVLLIEFTFLLLLLFFRQISIPPLDFKSLIPKRISKAETLVYFLIALILAFQFINVAFFPFFAYDSVRSYNEWAKVILLTGSVPPGYPPFTHTAYAFIYLFSSPSSENFAHILSFPFTLISLFYLFILTKESGGFGIISVVLLMATPWFLPISNSGYSDIFSLAFTLGSCYYLLRASSDYTLSSAFLAGLFGGMAASTKLYAPYLILMLPVSFVVFSVFNNRSRKRLMQLLVLSAVIFLVGSHWELRNIALGNTYVQRTFFSHSIDSTDPILIWGPERASNYLIRPFWALSSFLKNTQPQISIPVLLGVAFAVYYVFVKRGSVAASFLLAVVFLPVWLFLLSFEIRHVLIIYPLFLVAVSILLRDVWESIHKPSTFILVAILLFIPPFFDALDSSMIGRTRSSLQFPSSFYSINHLFDSDDEKRSAVFGHLFNVVMFIKSKDEIRNSTILTFDPRVKSYLETTNFSKENADYVVFYKGVIFKKSDSPLWAGTEIEDDLRGNRTRFFSTVYSSGTYYVLKLNKGAVETYMRDRNA